MKTVFKERLTWFHVHVDAFERPVEDRLSSAQTPDITTIWAEIQQLRTDMRATSSTPLVIPMPFVGTEVIDLFADEPLVRASGKRLRDDDDDSEAIGLDVA